MKVINLSPAFSSSTEFSFLECLLVMSGDVFMTDDMKMYKFDKTNNSLTCEYYPDVKHTTKLTEIEVENIPYKGEQSIYHNTLAYYFSGTQRDEVACIGGLVCEKEHDVIKIYFVN
jgi:hypothetical protein